MSIIASKSGLSRRSVLKAGAALGLFPAPAVLAQSPEPLKIGFLTVLTGPLAAGGRQQAAAGRRSALPAGAERHDCRPQG
jgi:hypothetical protein